MQLASWAPLQILHLQSACHVCLILLINTLVHFVVLFIQVLLLLRLWVVAVEQLVKGLTDGVICVGETCLGGPCNLVKESFKDS